MIDGFCVDAQMCENIVEDVFLNFQISYHISIKLSFQIKSDCLYVLDFISNLHFTILE